MAHQQKLTPLLEGHVIAAVEPPAPAAQTAAPVSPFAPSRAATWQVRFADGSTLGVRTNGSAPSGAEHAPGATVTDVTQHGTTLTLVLGAAPAAPAVAAADAAPEPLVFETAEAAACVILRDAAGTMAYAD